jgi:hypothetical protein
MHISPVLVIAFDKLKPAFGKEALPLAEVIGCLVGLRAPRCKPWAPRFLASFQKAQVMSVAHSALVI